MGGGSASLGVSARGEAEGVVVAPEFEAEGFDDQVVGIMTWGLLVPAACLGSPHGRGTPLRAA
jgi:hypothetical protein